MDQVIQCSCLIALGDAPVTLLNLKQCVKGKVQCAIKSISFLLRTGDGLEALDMEDSGYSFYQNHKVFNPFLGSLLDHEIYDGSTVILAHELERVSVGWFIVRSSVVRFARPLRAYRPSTELAVAIPLVIAESVQSLSAFFFDVDDDGGESGNHLVRGSAASVSSISAIPTRGPWNPFLESSGYLGITAN